MERIYKVVEVSKALGIGESTLRKWMAALQDAGYPWIVDENGWRKITESDLVSLRKFQEALASGYTMEGAAKEIAENYSPQERTANPLTRTSIERAAMERLDRLEEQLAALVEVNRELLRELKERDNERDRVLMETLRMMQETRQQIAATTEEAPAKKRRGGLFGWLRKS
jgi:DNA-binding transcriptional MerR regulator